MNTANLDTLGNKLANAALTTLIRLCPEVRTASQQQLEAACAAMRAKSGEAIDELLKDTRAASSSTVRADGIRHPSPG